MKILVTGASGFIGLNLVRGLAADGGHRIYALYHNHSVAEKLPGTDWTSCDLAKPGFSGDFPGEIDAIYHLAQSPHYKSFPDHVADLFAVNVQGTLELLEYARTAGCKNFIYASSGGIYGYGDTGFVEVAPLNPVSFYLSTKNVGEILVENYREYYTVVILRPFFAYGPGQKDRLIPNIVESVRSGRPIMIHNQTGIRINPIYVDDAVTAFVRALDLKESRKINVAGGEVLCLADIAKTVGEKLDREPEFEFVNAPNPPHLVGDITRMKEVLGLEPRITFDEGISRTIGAL